MSRKAIISTAAACAFAVAFPFSGRAKDNDQQDVVIEQDAVVNFGQAQPQQAPSEVTHLLDPDDVTIHREGTVTFVVNGGGHGIAIYPVARKTTREDIAEDLCQGPPGTAENDRLARATVCNATVLVNGTPTANLPYTVTDGRNNAVVLIPANVNLSSPRIDDMRDRLFATSGAIPGNATGNQAGAFLTGTAPPDVPGNRTQYRFLKAGRYLVLCMNRSHLINDHEFGFVTVVKDAGDDD